MNKAVIIILVSSLSLISMLDAQSSINDAKIHEEDKFTKECNVTNPVTRDPRDLIVWSLLNGARINLTQDEKCNLHCFLQKAKFVDENGNLLGTGLLNYTLKSIPEIAQYSDVLIAQIFQLRRSTKNMDNADKCKKAFINYHQFGRNIFTLAIAKSLPGAENIKKVLEKGEAPAPELQRNVDHYFQSINNVTVPYANFTPTAFTRLAQLVAFKTYTGVCVSCVL
ncbi:uncharacterized protein LOC135838567 [Planococcus citri]|uniref:uncharacterized protein LOC135838567 n=1 Tax=Planococcus citri TaxID=170843 RepID=UPI0031FA4486